MHRIAHSNCKTNKQTPVLSKLTILCWAEFIAILGHPCDPSSLALWDSGTAGQCVTDAHHTPATSQAHCLCIHVCEMGVLLMISHS